MIKAAGILFVSLNKHALFLKRGPKARDFPGYWDFPAGGQESDETPEQTAVRETREEIGFLPEGNRHLHTRQKMGAATAEGAVGYGNPIVPSEKSPPLVPAELEPTVAEPVDFSTFLQKVTNEFVPELSDEHVGWAWAPIDQPPEPLHPGCRTALQRIGMDELDVAKAIADGRLVSPQHYENVTLFAIRITGTSVAYRKARDEFCYRNPENYLNERFLARCNGLPVIFVQRSGKDGGFHPSGALLNSEEFAERVVGSIFLPYIAGREVWGIAKIYDADASRRMEEEDLSTSPAVFFRDADVNTAWKMEDGSTLLIEGNPSLLDHVAICERGVWDKGREPSGVRSEAVGDSSMATEAEKAAAAAKAAEEGKRVEARVAAVADAEGDPEPPPASEVAEAAEHAAPEDSPQSGEKLDRILAHLDSLSSRMDALEHEEEGEQEGEEEGEQEEGEPGSREDAFTDEDREILAEAAAIVKKRKEDATAKAKADSEELGNVAKRIDEIEKRIPKAIGDDDYHATVEAQARADDIFCDFGLRAPRPQEGETTRLYEQRVVRMLQPHSKSWAKVDLNKSNLFADDAGFPVLRDQVYGEAKQAARLPINIPAGQLRKVERQRDGHLIREFHGQPKDWMDSMAGSALKAEGRFKQAGLGAGAGS